MLLMSIVHLHTNKNLSNSVGGNIALLNMKLFLEDIILMNTMSYNQDMMSTFHELLPQCNQLQQRTYYYPK